MSITITVGRERIRFAGKTDVGRQRALNEDNLKLPSAVPLAVLADGMGGHACGEVASEIAVDAVAAYYSEAVDEHPPTWPTRLPQLHVERDRMNTAIKLANSQIFAAGKADPSKKGMGTTVDAVYFSQGRVYIGHVGDSRVYRLRAGQLDQLTEDHSLYNDYKRLKAMEGETVENFPHKNVVIRALGLSEFVFVDVLEDEYREGDVFMLCSDGLTDMIDDDQVRIHMRGTDDLDRMCAELIEAANEAGGKDNITAMCVRVEAQ